MDWTPLKTLSSHEGKDWHYGREEHKMKMGRRCFPPVLPSTGRAGQTGIHAIKISEGLLSFSEPESPWQLSTGPAAFYGTCHGEIAVNKMLHSPRKTELRCYRQIMNDYRQVEIPQRMQLRVQSLKGFLSSSKLLWESIQFLFYKAMMQNAGH